MLQHFKLHAHWTQMGNETGTALAEALKVNPVLHHFALHAHGAQMGDDALTALNDWEALQSKTSLQSFRILGTETSDTTYIQMQTALRLNRDVHFDYAE